MSLSPASSLDAPLLPEPHAGYFAAPLAASDPELDRIIGREFARQRDQIELIASENMVSRAVLEAQGSLMTNKTVEGYPGARYHGGADPVNAFRCQRYWFSVAPRLYPIIRVSLAPPVQPGLWFPASPVLEQIAGSGRVQEAGDKEQTGLAPAG